MTSSPKQRSFALPSRRARRSPRPRPRPRARRPHRRRETTSVAPPRPRTRRAIATRPTPSASSARARCPNATASWIARRTAPSAHGERAPCRPARRGPVLPPRRSRRSMACLATSAPPMEEPPPATSSSVRVSRACAPARRGVMRRTPTIDVGCARAPSPHALPDDRTSVNHAPRRCSATTAGARRSAGSACLAPKGNGSLRQWPSAHRRGVAASVPSERAHDDENPPRSFS